ncbi:MAG: hypothetical protein GF308_12010 [Candidatus Heimdallarchaeota archaeon]|nr:hypothetical protein [Candidatus Heimdallarchaeota archaeon]
MPREKNGNTRSSLSRYGEEAFDLEEEEEIIEDDETLEEIEEEESRKAKVIDGALVLSIEEISPKSALKKIRSHIKVYKNYETVMNRRTTDKAFRLNTAHYLTITNDILKEIHAMLIEKQLMSAWAIGERLIGEIDLTIRDLEKGDYGFTTFFENPKLLAIDLSQLYLLDYDLIETLIIMRKSVESFDSMVKQDLLDDVDLWLESIDRLVGRVIRLAEDRGKLIASYERISY